MQTISHKPTCTLSQFLHWLIRRNVRVIDSWDCCYQFLLVEGVQRHLSLVTKTQYCAVLVSRGGWYQVTVSLLPPLQPALGRWLDANVLWSPVLTAAESAVMHIMSANTIEADTILSIRYTQYWFRYDTDPIIVCCRIWTVNRSFSTRLTGYNTWAVLTTIDPS